MSYKAVPILKRLTNMPINTTFEIDNLHERINALERFIKVLLVGRVVKFKKVESYYRVIAPNVIKSVDLSDNQEQKNYVLGDIEQVI